MAATRHRSRRSTAACQMCGARCRGMAWITSTRCPWKVRPPEFCPYPLPSTQTVMLSLTVNATLNHHPDPDPEPAPPTQYTGHSELLGHHLVMVLDICPKIAESTQLVHSLVAAGIPLVVACIVQSPCLSSRRWRGIFPDVDGQLHAGSLAEGPTSRTSARNAGCKQGCCCSGGGLSALITASGISHTHLDISITRAKVVLGPCTCSGRQPRFCLIEDW